MNTMSLAISGISIKQDSHGRFCLNDLHKAAGSENRHRPKYWTALQQTQDLISLLESEDCNYEGGIPPSKISPLETVTGKGKQQGTFVVKELVYAYAMWISAKFQITVIRAYDALVNQQPKQPRQNPLPNALSEILSANLTPVKKMVMLTIIDKADQNAPADGTTSTNVQSYNDNRNASADQWWSRYLTGRR